MRPRPEDHSERKLQVITAEGQTLTQVIPFFGVISFWHSIKIEEMIKNSPYHGFPVVLSRSCMRLIGFVVSQDLQIAIDELRMQSQGTELLKLIFAQWAVYCNKSTNSSVHRHHLAVDGAFYRYSADSETRRAFHCPPFSYSRYCACERFWCDSDGARSRGTFDLWNSKFLIAHFRFSENSAFVIAWCCATENCKESSREKIFSII